MMGVETPIPPEMMNPAAPDGAPPRRIKTIEIIICRFSWFRCEPERFMCVSTEHFILKCEIVGGRRGPPPPVGSPALRVRITGSGTHAKNHFNKITAGKGSVSLIKYGNE